jgi:hypothetical protein
MSEVKVNKISPRAACGTVTLGDSGDTFTIPSGATINNQGTALNFGATGSASWVTTVKTGDFTAVAGEGYFVNTTSGEIDVTLPAGTAGAVVAIKDYAKTFDTNKVTLVRNGSDKIGGAATDATLTIEGLAVTLIFIDSTQGWLVTDSGLQSEAPTAEYITATGGSITTCGNFKIHAFTGPGTFEVTAGGNPAGSTSVDYLVVGGGGAGTDNGGGGAGGGGFRLGSDVPGKPALAAPAHSVSVQSYPITVGGGGAFTPNCNPNPNGADSIFSSFTAAGGGAGGLAAGPGGPGSPGGSGGGGAGNSRGGPGGSGNTPPVSPPQGNDGGTQGTSPNARSGGAGGGGASAAGDSLSGNASSPGSYSAGGAGGAGAPVTAVFGAAPKAYYPVPGPGEGYFAGGGGGALSNDGGYTAPAGAAGGLGGGGPGGPNNSAAVAAIANSGGGGGSSPTGGGAGTTSNGADGIVLIRYKFQ